MPPDGNGRPVQDVDAPLGEIVNRMSLNASALVREEIELAKAEVAEKVMKLVKGAVVGIAAGVFAIFGLIYLLHGFAWLAWFFLPVSPDKIFWGFFLVAGVLFLLGGLAGVVAARAFKAGSPPVPEMAIDEARLIKETVQAHDRRPDA